MGFITKIGKPFLILIIICVIALPISSIQLLFLGEEPGITPLLGLPSNVHDFIFVVIIPIIGSIVTVLLFSRVFTPVFLKAKRIIYRRHKNAFVNPPSNMFSIKKFLKRGVYIFLLTLGFLAFLLPIIDPYADLLIDDLLVSIYQGEGLKLSYILIVVMGVSGMILPIVLGLWSIGWILEDSGLIHYSLKGRLDQLFEIEPIHLRYNSYLKGYAGISAIVLLVQLILYFARFGTTRIADLITVLFIPAFNILYAVPAYLVYGLTTMNYKELRKGLPEARNISEDQLILKNK